MKLSITLLFAILISNMTNAQTPDCKKYRTGRFSYPELPGKTSLRKDSVQESYNNGKLEMIWKVRWITDCQYELTCIKLFTDEYPIKIGDRILTIILSTDETCYTSASKYFTEKNPEGIAMPAAPLCLVKD